MRLLSRTSSHAQFDEPQSMNPEARAVVDLVAGGTPVCNADMNDLHPDMSSAAAEIYASSIALAEFLHITYVNEEMRSSQSIFWPITLLQ